MLYRPIFFILGVLEPQSTGVGGVLREWILWGWWVDFNIRYIEREDYSSCRRLYHIQCKWAARIPNDAKKFRREANKLWSQQPLLSHLDHKLSWSWWRWEVPRNYMCENFPWHPEQSCGCEDKKMSPYIICLPSSAMHFADSMANIDGTTILTDNVAGRDGGEK